MSKVKVNDNCPVCNNKLEPIKNENDEVIDFWCDNCGRSYDLEDLEYEEVEEYKIKKLSEYFK